MYKARDYTANLSYDEMVKRALISIMTRCGPSVQEIVNYIKCKWANAEESCIKMMLKKLVKKGRILRVKNYFKLPKQDIVRKLHEGLELAILFGMRDSLPSASSSPFISSAASLSSLPSGTSSTSASTQPSCSKAVPQVSILKQGKQWLMNLQAGIQKPPTVKKVRFAAAEPESTYSYDNGSFMRTPKPRKRSAPQDPPRMKRYPGPKFLSARNIAVNN